MKTIEAFTQYYETDIKPELMMLEEKRLHIKKKLMPLIVLCGVVLIVSLWITGRFHISIRWMLFPLLFCAIVIGGWYLTFYRDFLSKFKERVIQKIVRFVDSALTYHPSEYVPKSFFVESRIFQDPVDRYEGDDLVSGTIGKTAIQFSEINAQHVEKTGQTSDTGSEKRTNTQTYPIFKGLFFVAEFNKDFSYNTIVLPDTAEKLFGRIGQKLQALNRFKGELIRLEDPEFEKQFVVYGEDQITSRYVLSTSLMKRISDFRKTANKNIFLSFISSKLFVAIPYERPLFEPSLFKSLVDFEKIREYLHDLQLAVGIVEDLNLNTRIWKKEERMEEKTE